MTAESTALRQDVRDVSVGLTVSLQNTDAECREQQMLHLRFWMFLDILDEIPVCVGYEIDGEVTTDFPVTHLLEKAKPVLENTSGLERRYQRNQKIRRSSGKLP